jgi:hypothetical protein
MVAICHNMDLGDAWEHPTTPLYPEKYASLAYRTDELFHLRFDALMFTSKKRIIEPRIQTTSS